MRLNHTYGTVALAGPIYTAEWNPCFPHIVQGQSCCHHTNGPIDSQARKVLSSHPIWPFAAWLEGKMRVLVTETLTFLILYKTVCTRLYPSPPPSACHVSSEIVSSLGRGLSPPCIWLALGTVWPISCSLLQQELMLLSIIVKSNKHPN